MRNFIVLLAFLYVVDGRNVYDRNQDQDLGSNEELDEKTDFVKSLRDHANNQMRHRRKARRTYYDYYEPNYDIMRDYSHHHEETLTKIERLLDEISWYLRRPQAPNPVPPPQPQIVYVPYPVTYPVPQYMNCTNGLTFKDRFPDLEDSNQNWGLVPGNTGKDIDNGKDGARPIDFNVVEPEEPVPKPPAVEHGSTQAGMESTTAAPRPGICQAAIIICCNLETKAQQQKCFYQYGCPKTFATGLSCKAELVKKVFDAYEKAYSLN